MKCDIAQSIGNNDNFDFLIDIIPRDEYNTSKDYKRVRKISASQKILFSKKRLNRFNHRFIQNMMPYQQYMQIQNNQIPNIPTTMPRQLQLQKCMDQVLVGTNQIIPYQMPNPPQGGPTQIMSQIPQSGMAQIRTDTQMMGQPIRPNP